MKDMATKKEKNTLEYNYSLYSDEDLNSLRYNANRYERARISREQNRRYDKLHKKGKYKITNEHWGIVHKKGIRKVGSIFNIFKLKKTGRR